jgi:hypothetical protein
MRIYNSVFFMPAASSSSPVSEKETSLHKLQVCIHTSVCVCVCVCVCVSISFTDNINLQSRNLHINPLSNFRNLAAFKNLCLNLRSVFVTTF